MSPTLVIALSLIALVLSPAKAQGVLTLTYSRTSEAREGGKLVSRPVRNVSLVINFNARAVKGLWADGVASITRNGTRFIWFGGNTTSHTQVAGTFDRITGKAEVFENADYAKRFSQYYYDVGPVL